MPTRCPGCMSMKHHSPICEHCGFDEGKPNKPHQLPMGTVLGGQYEIGRVLGQGGFGITYMGWDTALGMPVAIKEFYPGSLANRNCTVSTDVDITSAEMETVFWQNRERFLREAKILGMLGDVPGIVRVHNLFSENNTAYIVMEYIRGEDLRSSLKRQGRPMTAGEILAVLRPVIRALDRIHKSNLVHRDISPDNIMLLPDGNAKLLDFGVVSVVTDADAAKERNHSTMAILKKGFAPMEQYQTRGSLGPWTDVYAMCATIYYCLTGEVPPDAHDRMMEGARMNWAAVPGLTKQQITALEKGMALMPRERTASMAELERELYGTGQPEKPAEQKPEPVKKPGKPFGKLLAAAAVLCVIGVGILQWQSTQGMEKPAPETRPSAALPEETGETVPQTPEQLAYERAQALEADGQLAKAAIAFGKLGDYQDARQRSFALWAGKTITAGSTYAIAAKQDGTVVATGEDYRVYGVCAQWKDIVSVDSEIGFVVGLKCDGTVVHNYESNTDYADVHETISEWEDIVAIRTSGPRHTVGLKSDGTLVTTASGKMQEALAQWENIIDLDVCYAAVIGLRADGTVALYRADNTVEEQWKTVRDWTDIVSVHTVGNHVMGIEPDGRVKIAGWNTNYLDAVSKWTDIADIDGNQVEKGIYIIGVKADGTTVSVGNGGDIEKTHNWTGIVEVETTDATRSMSNVKPVIGLKSDGTVTVIGIQNPRAAYFDFSEFRDIRVPNRRSWSRSETKHEQVPAD